MFFFPVKSVIKLLFKSKRLRIVTFPIVQNEKSINEAANAFDINRYTLSNRVKNKKFAAFDHDKNCRFLKEIKKLTFLQFINKYCKLNFLFKYKIIKEIIMQLRVFRIETFKSIKSH